MSEKRASAANINESRVTGKHLLTSTDQPRLRIDRDFLEGGVTQYTVDAPIPLERPAINALMRMPFGIDGERWTDVRDGLQDIAYPSRRVRRMARSSVMATHLSSVRFAAWQLADVLEQNQDYRTQTANVPVFTYGQAQTFSYDMLVNTHPHRLINMMKSVGVDPKLARAFFGKELQSIFGVAELEALTGIEDSGDDPEHVLSDAMIEATQARYIVELMHRVQEDEFAGFVRRTTVSEDGLHFGNDDPVAFIRRRDVPVGIIPESASDDSDELNNAIMLDTKVDIGPVLRDTDRATGLERHRVTFSKQADRHVAWPRLVWQKNVEGERRLVFPSSKYETNTPGVVRTNSLLGAALVASVIGQDIDYQQELRRISHVRKGELPRSYAGLWPLVSYFRQEQLMKDPYFETIEDAVK
ncbi:MAG: hypothetical protein WAO28_01515 [Candidatus Microsaccharimonas sp.]